ncbi:MAG: acetylxylan esterase [Chitinophagaceae bacterium]|nr:acetylxylan esterase [Chitinophagaceae bacterium]
MRLLLFPLLLLFIISTDNYAQPTEQLVRIEVAPDHADWLYKTGERARFSVTVLRNNVPLKDAKINYQIGLEKMKPSQTADVTLTDGKIMLDGGTLKEAGFLRCAVTIEFEGKQYRNIGTAGFDVAAIQPTVTTPSDFDSFWAKARTELDKIPVDAKMTLLPERSSALTNVYHLNLQGYGNSRLYGILCIPKKEGKYPALLHVPGAGVRPYGPDLEMADKGIIVLTVGIHGIPVIMEPGVYADLAAGALSGYPLFNAHNKDKYYYKRVYMNCIRANDFLTGLPQFDGKNLAVTGGSQGGALSIVTAGLDSRVQYLAAVHPALSDLTGYLKGRAGGWPHLFYGYNLSFTDLSEIKETIPYFDVVNFAKKVKIEGFYTWGFNDEVCPPTSMYAAYNVISAPKSIAVFAETGHWMFPEQRNKLNSWLVSKLRK